MAKQTKQKSIEETLWDSANKLRGSVESSEYKHVVLGLIFLNKAAILIMTFDLPKQSNFERRNLLFKDCYCEYSQ
jgi:type I restriction-modification system DNA methylase subunit